MKTIQLTTTQLAHCILAGNPGMDVGRATDLAARAVARRRASETAESQPARAVTMTAVDDRLVTASPAEMARTLSARRRIPLADAQAIIVKAREEVWQRARSAPHAGRDDGGGVVRSMSHTFSSTAPVYGHIVPLATGGTFTERVRKLMARGFSSVDAAGMVNRNADLAA